MGVKKGDFYFSAPPPPEYFAFVKDEVTISQSPTIGQIDWSKGFSNKSGWFGIKKSVA